MREHAIKKPLSKNQLSDLTDALVNVMKYSDSSVEYPNFEKAKQDDGVMAEWFYPIYNGSNSFSELSAIHMYTCQEAIFENIGELLLGIALTEMKHFDKLSDFILKIGGKVTQTYIDKDISIGVNEKEALENAILAEEKTIEFYKNLKNKIEGVPETDTTTIALQFLIKLLADENVHYNLLLREAIIIE